MLSRVLLIVLATTFGLLPAHAQEQSAWPMFRGDAAHSGRSSSIGPVLPSLQWQHDLDAPSYASPAVGPGGTIYAASSSAVYAVAPDGTESWRAPLPEFTVASPAVVGGDLVVVASSDGTVQAYDAATGSIAWTVRLDDDVWASPVVGPSRLLYVATASGSVYALDASDGAEQWRQQLPDEILATPALHDGRLYIVDFGGRVLVADAATGREVSRMGLPTDVISSPAIDADGILYVGGIDGRVYAVEPLARQLAWVTSVGGELISSPALGAEGPVYIGSTDRRVVALSKDSGQQLWSKDVGAPVFSSPVLDAADRLYVGSADTSLATGRLYALDAESGAVEWSYATSGPAWASPALDDAGNLHITSVGTGHAPGQLYRIEPAMLSVESGGEAVAGSDHEIDVSPASSFSPTSGTLHFRPGGGSPDDYAEVALTPGGSSSFTASIPGTAVTLRGLEYYVSMTDGETTITLPASEPAEHPLVDRVLVEQMELPRELPVRGYSMISVPAELARPSIDDVLVDDYGAPGFSSWRLFRWFASDEAYREYPRLSAAFDPGTAFFLAHREGARFAIEEARSIDSSVPYVVTLLPGWNQVGTPFAFPIDWSSVSVRGDEPDAVREIAYYNGSEMEQATLQNPGALAPMQPWQGYFFNNRLAEPVEVVFQPDEAEAQIVQESAASRAAPRRDYWMRLSARGLSSTLLDTQNWLGLNPEADDKRDALDLAEAPPIDAHLRLSVVEEGVRYATNVKAATDEGQRWNLEVAIAPSPDEPQWVEVTLDELGPRPPGFEINVVDEDARQSVSLIDGRFRVQVGGEHPVRHISLVVGTPAYTADALEGVRPHQPALFLDQNAPNPFVSSTTIPYSLEQTEHVTLDIFNVMGQHVATLVDRRQEAGRHQVTWDARGGAGAHLASGLYVYRLRVGPHVVTRKMLLLR